MNISSKTIINLEIELIPKSGCAACAEIPYEVNLTSSSSSLYISISNLYFSIIDFNFDINSLISILSVLIFKITLQTLGTTLTALLLQSIDFIIIFFSLNCEIVVFNS